jgi:hypothetical protein
VHGGDGQFNARKVDQSMVDLPRTSFPRADLPSRFIY